MSPVSGGGSLLRIFHLLMTTGWTRRRRGRERGI